MRTAASARPPMVSGVPDATISPRFDDRDPIGEVLRLVHVVSREDDRRALAPQLVDELPRAAAGGRVEPGGGLVEEQQLRCADDAERDVEPALLPARQRLHSGVGLVHEPDELEHVVHRRGFG